MNGADALISASRAASVEVCFANPGTTEMAMVDALTRSKAIRGVPTLFEGVASGAADGYARIAGKPASVMLHLGPGLGNATANLHNARRGQSPVVVWVGDHATWLSPYDPPLASDVAAIAHGTSKWVRTAATAAALPFDAVQAVVVDEGITSSLALYPALTGAPPHDYIACKGGSIGFGIPVATGASVAAPGRRVIAYVGDGSAAYTIQALWTQAREGLNVTTIVLCNEKYAVLQMELLRSGGALEGAGFDLTELNRPSPDFEAIAKGFGVPARTVRDTGAFVKAFRESLATAGPTLISCVFG